MNKELDLVEQPIDWIDLIRERRAAEFLPSEIPHSERRQLTIDAMRGAIDAGVLGTRVLEAERDGTFNGCARRIDLFYKQALESLLAP